MRRWRCSATYSCGRIPHAFALGFGASSSEPVVAVRRGAGMHRADRLHLGPRRQLRDLPRRSRRQPLAAPDEQPVDRRLPALVSRRQAAQLPLRSRRQLAALGHGRRGQERPPAHLRFVVPPLAGVGAERHADLLSSDANNGDWEVYLMNTDGSAITNLTNTPGYDYSPNWSPDGSQIAFVSERDGNAEIYVMNPDGSNQRRLTNNDDRRLARLVGVVDRQPHPLWPGRRGNRRDVRSMLPDGSDDRLELANAAVSVAGWSPDARTHRDVRRRAAHGRVPRPDRRRAARRPTSRTTPPSPTRPTAPPLRR